MPDTSKTTRTRSPEHPAITLEEAIRRTEILYNQEDLNQVPVATVLDHWGYTRRSGLGQRILAALRHYGLLEEKGSGQQRVVWLSDIGKVLVLKDRDDPEWVKACQEAALAPSIHAQLWDKWEGNRRLPSDSTIRWELANRGFNRKAIDGFSATLRDTLEFANLLDDGSHDTPSGGSDAPDAREPEPDPPAKEPDNSPGSAGPPMPSTDTSATKDWDLNIPLVSGGQAVLRIPIPLSETDFELVKAVVNANLDALKQSITRQPAGTEDLEEE
jgi:hypothetical protein